MPNEPVLPCAGEGALLQRAITAASSTDAISRQARAYAARRVGGVNVACAMCGSTFRPPPVRIVEGRAKYCSRPCYDARIKRPQWDLAFALLIRGGTHNAVANVTGISRTQLRRQFPEPPLTLPRQRGLFWRKGVETSNAGPWRCGQKSTN